MKAPLLVAGAALCVAVLAVCGCVPSLRSLLPQSASERAAEGPEATQAQPGAPIPPPPLGPPPAAPGAAAPPSPGAPGQTGGLQKPKPSGLSDAELDKLMPPPPPADKRSASSAVRAEPAWPIDSLQLEEVKQDALRFIKEIPRVKHSKLCYSQPNREWYLTVWTQEEKVVTVRHFTWEPKSKEFAGSYTKDLALSPKALKDQVETDLEGDRCTRLK